MNIALLNFSHRVELQLIADVVAPVMEAASALHASAMITGALARDLLIFHQYGINTVRQTEDVDIAFAIQDWKAFGELRERLIASGNFAPIGRALHSLRHSNGLPIDLVPFGGIELPDRHIAWPPAGDFVMNVFGFREALATALYVLLPNQLRVKVISLPALAMLKLITWQDRHLRTPRKDAHDLALILNNYLECGNQERLWNEFSTWTEEEDFNYELAGARMLGHDIKALLDEQGQTKFAAILANQINIESPSTLPQEMFEYNVSKAHALLLALYEGLTKY